jgi:hypothetical protein
VIWAFKRRKCSNGKEITAIFRQNRRMIALFELLGSCHVIFEVKNARFSAESNLFFTVRFFVTKRSEEELFGPGSYHQEKKLGVGVPF